MVESKATMSDKAEAAFQEWCTTNRVNRRYSAFSLLVKCWQDSYAAAFADTERLVRAAIEATIEEAAKQRCFNCADDVPIELMDGVPHHLKQSTGVSRTMLRIRCYSQDIRAMSVDAILARVLGKEVTQ